MGILDNNTKLEGQNCPALSDDEREKEKEKEKEGSMNFMTPRSPCLSIPEY